MHIKIGDEVVVLTGKDKGKTGKVVRTSPKENTLVVDGLNLAKKHKKPRSAQEKGGIETFANKMDASNVMLICPKCQKATRAKNENLINGKERVCRKCNEVILTAKVARTGKKEKKSDKKPAKVNKPTKAANEPKQKIQKPAVKKPIVRTTDKAGS